MKRFIVLFFLFLIPLKAYALAETANSAIVMDIDSNRVIYEKNSDEQRLIASITKIMTAVVAIENAKLDGLVTVGPEVLKMYGSNIYIELGEKMTLKDLLYGLLLRSGNDAAVVIATYVGKSEEAFVQMMNDKAQELGMVNTIFNNPHGLDEETKNYSTARDMAILSSYAMTIKEYREISSTKIWRVQSEKKSYLWENRNRLLNLYEYATGGKTGYTPKAGRTLVTTALKDALNLTAVTLNDPDEYKTHEDMYEYVFNNYKKYLVLDKNNFVVNQDLYKGVYIKNSFYYPLTIEESENLKVIVKVFDLEDYKNNDSVGEVLVSLYDEVIYKDNIYVVKEKEKVSFLGKVVQFFSGLFRGFYD